MNRTERALLIAFLSLLARAALAPRATCEVPFAGGKLSASVESIHRYAARESALNPGNVHGIDEGYADQARYALGYAVTTDRYSFTFNDYGNVSFSGGLSGCNRVGEIYTTVKLGTVFVDLGKKRVCQSQNYFKSPINFALEDYSDFDLRYSNGRAMANLEWFSDFGVVALSFIPEIDFKGNLARYLSPPQRRQWYARYDVTVGDYAIGLAASFDYRWRTGAQVSRSVGRYAEAHAELVFDEKRERVELVESANPSVPPEIRAGSVRNRLEAVIGLTVNLPRVSVIAEYYGTGAGYSAREWEAIADRYREIARADMSEPVNLYAAGLAMSAHALNAGINGRNYLMIRVSNPSTDEYELSLTALANLQDSGVILMPAVGYSGWDNLSVKASFMKRFGGPYAEYSLYGTDWECALSMELSL